MVPVVDKFFGCNRMQLGNTRDLYVLRQDVYERFLCIQRPGFSENVVYINKLLNSDRRYILRSDKLKLLQLNFNSFSLNSFNKKNTVLTFLVKKRSFPGCLFFENMLAKFTLSQISFS